MKKLICLLPVLVLVFTACEKDSNTPNNNRDTANIQQVTVDYLYDNCTYVLTHKVNPPGVGVKETISGVEHNAEFTSTSGSSAANETYFVTNWNSVVLGKTTQGKMEIYFKDNGTLNMNLLQTREFSSVVTGSVYQAFTFNAQGLEFIGKSTEDGYPVEEFGWSGSKACTGLVTFLERNSQYESELTQVACGARARVTVKVFYKS